ncbi:MAG: metallophosphoesterase [Clostridia bacterium]|nr:metallophosphoesterase [Clostridia bacterium]
MIYITGDLHGEITRLSKLTLTADDTLIVCGDFGFACHVPAENDFGLAWLARQPYTVLFIDGNHDNHDWLDAMPAEELYGGTVHRVRDNVFHLMRGQVYTIDGYRFFTMGGAASVDKPYRLQNGLPWWERELPNGEELAAAAESLETVDWQVDVVLTHTAPRAAIEALDERPYPPEAPLSDFLDALYADLTFSAWFFGHWHQDRVVGEKLFAIHEQVIPLS